MLAYIFIYTLLPTSIANVRAADLFMSQAITTTTSTNLMHAAESIRIRKQREEINAVS